MLWKCFTLDTRDKSPSGSARVDVQVQGGEKIQFCAGVKTDDVYEFLGNDARAGAGGTLSDQHDVAVLRGALLTTKGAPYLYRMFAASPRAALAAWTLSNPLQPQLSVADLRQLLSAMPLPAGVRKVLQDSIYHVPEEGLFVCSAAASEFKRACPRHDWVDLLVSKACTLVPTTVLLVHSLHRTGKTFSMPWVLLEAIRRLLGGKGGGGVDSAAGGRRLAPRNRYVLVVQCQQVTPLGLEEIPVLLAAAAYLRIPAVFDEFSNWLHLPAALEGFLEGRIIRQPHLALLPLHFVLQDSMQAHVVSVAGGSGVLYRRANLGVQGAVQMPQPTVQLLAGMLQAYHPALYPDRLLRVVATSGRMLDCIVANPQPNLQDLGIESLRQHAILQDDHLAALRLAVECGSSMNNESALILQLMDAGLLEFSPLNPLRLYLADPTLITVRALRSGFTPPIKLERLEELMGAAEGKVLEVLVRMDMMSSIIERLGLTGHGQPDVWWGDLAKAEVDLLMCFASGPLVWVSCKRSADDQGTAAFLPHIRAVEAQAAGSKKGLDAQLAKAKISRHASLREQYDHLPAVLIMRCMTAGGGLRLVGVSAKAPKREEPRLLEGYDVEFEGSKHVVPCNYLGLLFNDLVQPIPAEDVHYASPCCWAPLP